MLVTGQDIIRIITEEYKNVLKEGFLGYSSDMEMAKYDLGNTKYRHEMLRIFAGMCVSLFIKRNKDRSILKNASNFLKSIDTSVDREFENYLERNFHERLNESLPGGEIVESPLETDNKTETKSVDSVTGSGKGSGTDSGTEKDSTSTEQHNQDEQDKQAEQETDKTHEGNLAYPKKFVIRTLNALTLGLNLSHKNRNGLFDKYSSYNDEKIGWIINLANKFDENSVFIKQFINSIGEEYGFSPTIKKEYE